MVAIHGGEENGDLLGDFGHFALKEGIEWQTWWEGLKSVGWGKPWGA